MEEYNCNKKHFYFVKDKWVLGWDYNHAGDYTGYGWNGPYNKYQNSKGTRLSIYVANDKNNE